MAAVAMSEYIDSEPFAWEWHADPLTQQNGSLTDARDHGLIDEDETRLRWQRLGHLDSDELLIQLLEWLAEEKVGYGEGATPTAFVGRIARETANASLCTEAAAADPLLKLAHRMHRLETGEADPERDDWMEARLQKLRRRFEQRDDAATLQDEWLPKSQLQHVLCRV